MTMMSEIALDIFRIFPFVSDFNLQFSQYGVRDGEALLFRAGPRLTFSSASKIFGGARYDHSNFSRVHDRCQRGS